MRLESFAVLVALVASSASAQTVMDESRSNVSEEIMERFGSALVDEVSDPYSSQLIDLHIRNVDLGTIVTVMEGPAPGMGDVLCGRINTKDRSGTYAGFAWFIYLIEDNQLALMGRGDKQPKGCS